MAQLNGRVLAMRTHILLLLVTASAFAQSPLRFDNYQVHRVIPRTQQQLNVLKQIELQNGGYNFWKDITGVNVTVDIMVPPHKKYDFEDLLKLENLESELFINNVQTLIDEETPVHRNRSQRAFGWNDYQTLDKINQWLDKLKSKYSGIVSVVVGGKSHEGRQIRGIKISYKSGNKGILVEGGIHAREWISPATVTYIANQLLTSTNIAVREIAENYDWYIFPSVNPDGYVYTHKKNRMWRKTRKPYPPCKGADPNRNWGYHWMEGGASNDPCSDSYAGSSAFSEIETSTFSSYIKTIGPNLEIFLSFHSYLQVLLIPFGHGGREVPVNNEELQAVGKNAAKALAQRYGTHYRVGNIPKVLYVASGGSCDWILGNFRNIRFPFTFELRDTGTHGFVLPPEQIIPTGEETLDAVVSIVKQALALRNK